LREREEVREQRRTTSTSRKTRISTEVSPHAGPSAGAAHADDRHHVPLLHDASAAVPLLCLGAHRHTRLAPPAASASAVEKLESAVEQLDPNAEQLKSTSV
jgi:hypothetical protein